MKVMKTMILLGIIIHLVGCSPVGENDNQNEVKILPKTKLNYRVTEGHSSSSKCISDEEGDGCGTVDIHVGKCDFFEADAIVVGRYGKSSFISHCEEGKYGPIVPVNLIDVDVLHYVSGEDLGKSFKINTFAISGPYTKEGDMALMAVTRGENGELFLTGNIYILPENGQNLGYTDKDKRGRTEESREINYIIDLPTTVSGLNEAFRDFDITKVTECPKKQKHKHPSIGAYRQYSYLIGELCDEPPKFSSGDSGESGPDSDLAGG